jgi:hypothetical protein
MQRVYDSEINATIEWLWDGGFSLKLGDPDQPDRGQRQDMARSRGLVSRADYAALPR